MTTRPTLLQALLLRLLPAHLRDSCWGDLLEDAPQPPLPLWADRQLLGLALHWQAEPWRERSTVLRALMLLLAAGGLLWLLPMVSASLQEQAVVFEDPLSRTALSLWRAEASVAGAAVGLLLGRASVLPEHASAVRGQGALALALVLGAHAGPLPALWLLATAWLGHRHRLLG